MYRTQEEIEKIILYATKSLFCTVITDEFGNLVFLSDSYKEILGVTGDDYIGRPIQEVILNSEIPKIIETREEDIGSIFVLKNGQPVACNRTPIYHEGVFYGVISTCSFSDLSTVSKFHEKVEELSRENLLYKKKLAELQKQQRYSIENIVGDSPEIMRLKKLVQRFAPSDLTVMVSGETGTGKEVFANAIHKLSPRSNEKYIKINCAAIPKDLLESELFGYEAGAFSGASSGGKAGKFEAAGHGTILLDEISEMSMSSQSKLLRVLQEREFERVGGLKTLKLNARIICSTNRDLGKMVKEGTFRQDLYYRINVVEFKIPPLRDRIEDIYHLSRYFLDKINEKYGLGITDVSDSVWDMFRTYEWKGNVRELEHVLERACVMAGWGVLDIQHLDFLVHKIDEEERNMGEDTEATSLEDATSQVEVERIRQALEEAGGNKAAAAKLLNIDRSTLYYKIRKHNIK